MKHKAKQFKLQKFAHDDTIPKISMIQIEEPEARAKESERRRLNQRRIGAKSSVIGSVIW